MKLFSLHEPYSLTPDQNKAVTSLEKNFRNGKKYQVLLGVTGSGKTFVMAKLIERLQMPALVISHNKTLAGQLYQELRSFFPKNAVSFFISYYDYYQPEAYIPSTDTYIEKDSSVNDLIDQLRLETTSNILSRKDTVTVASVSCIYNLGSPKSFGNLSLKIEVGQKNHILDLSEKLVKLQYERNDFELKRGTFRLRGEYLDIYPSNCDFAVRIAIENDICKSITRINPVSGDVLAKEDYFTFYPAKHFILEGEYDEVFENIRKDMEERASFFESEGNFIAAQRIRQKVEYDLEMIKEFGYVKGIENYSRYFDGRKEGDPPYSLLDYFRESYGKNWLVIVDESHISFPQIRGMIEGDKSRKKNLIDYGFRLPSAFDNRPLKFDEFLERIPNFIAFSATPDEWEIEFSKGQVVELLTRPTGIPDPQVIIRPVKNQIEDLIGEITNQVSKSQRTLVTTLTKKTAEDLSFYLKEKGFNVCYLHSEIKTLERSDILDGLRRGDYDVLVGVNLLREGLDLPEVSLVAVLDADKEGFLRSKTSLIQTMGRAARHIEGRVILYADNITGSIKKAVSEVERRRKYQLEFNRKYNISPKSITKPVREKIIKVESKDEAVILLSQREGSALAMDMTKIDSLTPMDKKKLIKRMEKEMREAAHNLDFETAILLRDKIREIRDSIFS